MTAIKDLSGVKSGRLTALYMMPRDTWGTKGPEWLCQCDCGNTKVVLTKYFGKATRSCGCLHHESAMAMSARMRADPVIQAKRKQAVLDAIYRYSRARESNGSLAFARRTNGKSRRS